MVQVKERATETRDQGGLVEDACRHGGDHTIAEII